MLSWLMTLFGGLALLLAAVGLYGVTAYGVARRTSEIGIRMALGAERRGVVAMILRSAMAQTLIGMAIGVPLAFYGVTLVKSQLYEMTTVSSRGDGGGGGNFAGGGLPCGDHSGAARCDGRSGTGVEGGVGVVVRQNSDLSLNQVAALPTG